MPSSSLRRAHASSSSNEPPTSPESDNHAYELQPIYPKEDSDEDEDSHLTPSRPSSPTSIESYELYTPTEDRLVLRKLDRKLVAFLALLYSLSFLDRSNIGNARIAGLAADLHLSDTQYEWLLWAFYITYIAFEWMTLLYRVVPPHVYIALCIASWGIIASVQATANSFGFLLVLRALLGVSEAAFGPGVPFYLSFFFRREELAFRTGLFISASPLSASFAGALAWLITKVGEKGPLSPWRLLFLIEGFPSVLVAVWAWDFIPDGPGVAKWLSPRERKVAVLRLRAEKEDEDEDDDDNIEGKHTYGTAQPHRLNLHDVLLTLKDPKCYLTALMFFAANVAFASMPVFLPTILHDMGHPPLTAQALTAPPYLTAFLAVLATAHLSDRHRSRAPYIILHALLASTSYAAIALCSALRYQSPTPRYIALFPATAGFFSAVTLIITWTLNNQTSAAGKGTGVAIMNVIGQMGPLVGTSIFPSEDGPWYVRGMSVCAAFMLLVALLAGALRWYLARENERTRQAWGGEYPGVGRRNGKRRFEYIL